MNRWLRNLVLLVVLINANSMATTNYVPAGPCKAYEIYETTKQELESICGWKPQEFAEGGRLHYAEIIASMRLNKIDSSQCTDHNWQTYAPKILNHDILRGWPAGYRGNGIQYMERPACIAWLKSMFGGGPASNNAGDRNSQPQQSHETRQRPNQSQQSPQQNQAAQQQSQQAQQQARQTQARADQARQGQRRRHEPENEANHCIQPDFGGLYGSMKNTCSFKVHYTYCGYRPKENSWLTVMNCEKQSFGSGSVSPGRVDATHTKGVEMLYWIACKEPAWALDGEFVPGQGVRGRCYTVGGK